MRQQIVKQGLTGLNQATLEQQGQLFAEQYIPSVLRQQAIERIQWHQQRGDRIILVSASLDVYLKPWCQQMAIELCCAELAVNNHKLSGHYRNGDCTGQAKANRVKAMVDLAQFSRIYAYGDTAEDKELLALADEAYLQWQRI